MTQRTNSNGLDALLFKVEEPETFAFLAAIDQNCLKLMAEVEVGSAGSINFVHDWNTLEHRTSLFALSTGYGMKHDTLMTGGMTVAGIQETVLQFQSAMVRFYKELRAVRLLQESSYPMAQRPSSPPSKGPRPSAALAKQGWQSPSPPLRTKEQAAQDKAKMATEPTAEPKTPSTPQTKATRTKQT